MKKEVRTIEPLNLEGCQSWEDLLRRVERPTQRLLIYPILCAALVRQRGATKLDDSLFRTLIGEMVTGTAEELMVEPGDGFVIIRDPVRAQN